MIIGFTGKIGSGKTTASEYLKKYDFVEYSMASPLKKIGEIFHFTSSQLYGTQEQKLQINEHWGISAREFLQKFGTDVCRVLLPQTIPNMKLSPSVWIRLFEIERAKNPKTHYVVSDVRFLDEAECIQKMGGVIIRLTRGEEKEGDEHKHASELEQEQIKTNYCIVNNSSDVKILYEELDSIMSKLLVIRKIGYKKRYIEF